MNFFSFSFFLTSDLCIEQASFFFFIQKLPCKKNLGVPFKRPTSLHLIRFVEEPGHLMKNSRKIQQTHSAVEKCTRGSAVQTSETKYWFLETTHTSDRTTRIKDNLSVAGD